MRKWYAVRDRGQMEELQQRRGGLRQVDVARIAEISQPYYSQLLGGTRLADAATAARIARALTGVSTRALVDQEVSVLFIEVSRVPSDVRGDHVNVREEVPQP